MKKIIFFAFIFFTISCSSKDYFKEVLKPKSNDQLYVYIERFINTPNLAICDRKKGKYTDHIICIETETDRTYAISMHDWIDHNLPAHYMLVRKKDILAFLQKNQNFLDFVCGLDKFKCEKTKFPPKPELIPFLRAK